jgi:hypothetical protein
MGRLSLAALMIWALCFVGTDCGSAKVQSPQSPQTKTDESTVSPVVTLTDKHPSSSSPVPASVPAGDSKVLEVVVTKVVNPNMTPVTIFVYLSDSKKDKPEPEQNPIGNFSLYPADRPGKFLLNAAPAINRASGSAATSKSEMRLVFEMKRIHENKAWTSIEVTIGPPKWRAGEK